MRLLGEIIVLLGVYKFCILAVGDCLTDVPEIRLGNPKAAAHVAGP